MGNDRGRGLGGRRAPALAVLTASLLCASGAAQAGASELSGVSTLEQRFVGTCGKDNLVGDELANLIRGRRGGDRIHGRGGNNCLRGSRGNDRIRGGDGDDEIHGSAGSDRLAGGAGATRSGAAFARTRSRSPAAMLTWCAAARASTASSPTSTTPCAAASAFAGWANSDRGTFPALSCCLTRPAEPVSFPGTLGCEYRSRH